MSLHMSASWRPTRQYHATLYVCVMGAYMPVKLGSVLLYYGRLVRLCHEDLYACKIGDYHYIMVSLSSCVMRSYTPASWGHIYLYDWGLYGYIMRTLRLCHGGLCGCIMVTYMPVCVIGTYIATSISCGPILLCYGDLCACIMGPYVPV